MNEKQRKKVLDSWKGKKNNAQRFFQTRAGKGLQSAVNSLYEKHPNSKALKWVLWHLLPF